MHLIHRRAALVTALGALVVALATAGLASAHCFKPYSVVLKNDVTASGSTVTATVLNETAHQRLGSANLTAPAGYVLSSATTSQGSVTVVGNVVELRNAALMPGQSLTITIQLSSSTCSTSTWTVEAKQANNFRGRGNNLTLDTANSNLNTAVCSAPCKMNATCTTDAGNANGNALVKALKADNTAQLLESVNPSNLEPLTCENPNGSDYLSADPNTYGVFATAHRKKVVTITITNPVISIPLSQQQVCYDAPYKFRTAKGAPLLPDGNGGFVGLLPSCGRDPDFKPGSGPCHDRDDDKMIGSSIVLVVNIPSGLPGDPHME